MYLDDFDGALPPNATSSTGGRDGFQATAATWFQGNAWTDTASSNIENGVLFQYNRSIKIYKCPADRSTVRDQGKTPRFRSVAMNSYMNDLPDPNDRTCWHSFSQIMIRCRQELSSSSTNTRTASTTRFKLASRGEWLWIDFRHTAQQWLCFQLPTVAISGNGRNRTCSNLKSRAGFKASARCRRPSTGAGAKSILSLPIR